MMTQNWKNERSEKGVGKRERKSKSGNVVNGHKKTFIFAANMAIDWFHENSLWQQIHCILVKVLKFNNIFFVFNKVL